MISQDLPVYQMIATPELRQEWDDACEEVRAQRASVRDVLFVYPLCTAWHVHDWCLVTWPGGLVCQGKLGEELNGFDDAVMRLVMKPPLVSRREMIARRIIARDFPEEGEIPGDRVRWCQTSA